MILNGAADKTLIDPSLVRTSDSRTICQRIASAQFIMQVREKTVIKTVTRRGDSNGVGRSRALTSGCIKLFWTCAFYSKSALRDNGLDD